MTKQHKLAVLIVREMGNHGCSDIDVINAAQLFSALFELDNPYFDVPSFLKACL